MRVKMFIFVAMLGLLAHPHVAAGQTEDGTPHAPRIEQNGRQFDIPVRISGSGSIPGGDDVLLRLPQTRIDLSAWLTGNAELLAAHKAAPTGWSWVSAQLDIDTTGAVTGCKPNDLSAPPLTIDRMCRLFGTIPFVPALAKSGESVSGNFYLSMSMSYEPVSRGSPPRPLIDDSPEIRMSPPSPMPNLVPTEFPPSPLWMRTYYTEPVWAVTPIDQWQEPVAGTTSTSVVISWDSKQAKCHSVDQDAQASDLARVCAYAQSTLSPKWPDALPYQRRAVPLLVHQQPDGTFTANGPAKDPRMRTTLPPESEVKLLTQLKNAGLFPRGREHSDLRLSLRAAADGSVEHCRVARTSGSDAGDIAACDVAYRTVRLAVAQDIFGRPARFRSLFWDARVE